MASTTSVLAALPIRKSIYALSPSSPIPDSRIQSILTEIITHCPSPFNSQPVRVVLLLGAASTRLWSDVSFNAQKAHMGEGAFTASGMGDKMKGFGNAYGTALFYDAPEAWDETQAKLGERATALKDLFPDWTEHSNGMHQFALWTALSAEGLGCNLQHYVWLQESIAEAFDINKNWRLRAELVFGKPEGGRRAERTYKPVEGERLFVKTS